MDNVNIVFISHSDTRFDEVKRIRTAVFTMEQGAIAKQEFDEYDNSAVFALLYDGEKAVGTARIAFTDNGCKIGRIAIDRAYRGRGYGAVIVNAVTEKAFAMGNSLIYVDAQNYAVPFYEKLGFEIIGTEIIDRGLPHIPMSITKGENYGKGKEEK